MEAADKVGGVQRGVMPMTSRSICLLSRAMGRVWMPPTQKKKRDAY